MAATSCTIVVADASVVINFLRINRVDLLAGLPLHFTLTDHVAHEVSDRYPDQRKRLASAFDASILSQIAVTNPEELALFGSLAANGRLGAGECSAIAVAVHRNHILAIDGRRAIIEARRTDQAVRIVTTQDLIVSMIRQRLLTVPEADVIKEEWATKHRFRLKLNSFQDLVA